MNPPPDALPTPEELAEARALAAFLDGKGPPPTVEDGEIAGLLRSVPGLAPAARPARPRWGRRIATGAAVLALAATLALVLRPGDLPGGATPEDHAAALAALSGGAPFDARLDALERLARRARAPIAARLQGDG